jgi:hypothetical protein
MSVTEKINERVQQLPERTQTEVLDFVENLLAKAERQQALGGASVVSNLRIAGDARHGGRERSRVHGGGS